MDNLTKIDVVFPVYNGGVAFLGTLRSFSKVPDFSNIHLIISDNFSSDGSPWLPEVEKMKDAGWSVRIVSPPHFLSRVDHWTWAFEQGNSPYVKMVPVGDEILPDYFDCMLPLMDEYRAVMGICGFITHEDGKKRAPDESRTLDIYTGIAYLEKNADCGNIAGPLTAVLFRRSVVEKFLPFNPDVPWAADWLLCLSVAQQGISFNLHKNLVMHNREISRFSSGIEVVFSSIREEWDVYKKINRYLGRRPCSNLLVLMTVTRTICIKYGKICLPKSIRKPLGKMYQKYLDLKHVLI